MENPIIKPKENNIAFSSSPAELSHNHNGISQPTKTKSTNAEPDWQGAECLANFQANCEALRPRAPELVQQLKICPFPQSSLAQPIYSQFRDRPDIQAKNQKENSPANPPNSARSLMNTEANTISAQRSRDGHWILCFQNKPIYSRYKPLDEALRWVEKDLRAETNGVIFAGFGLAYQIDNLLNKRSRALILVVESSYALFKAALCLRDLSYLFSNPCFFCTVGPEANLELYLHYFSERQFQFYQLQALYHSQPNFYRPLQQRILSLLSRFRINANTLNRFGQLWVRNIAMNLHFIAGAVDAGIFYSRFQNLPFLLVAAGPSLENLLPALPQLRERFVILAVDTALKLLLQQNIEPDFVLSVDPQLLNARHFDFCDSPSSILISESCIYPSIFQRKWRLRALFHSSFPIMSRLEQHLNTASEKPEFAQIRSGGSVATAAWDFARNCQASELYIAGLDLSYPNLHSHCTGTMPQSNNLNTNSRLRPMEHLNWQITIAAGHQQVASWFGPHVKVLSDKRMTIYRNWLEENIRNHNFHHSWPNYIIDGAAGHAAQIKGMELISLDQALSKPLRRREIRLCMEQILQPLQQQLQNEKVAIQSQKLGNAIMDLLSEIRDIYHWSSELLGLLCDQHRNTRQEKRLNELHGKIAQSPSRSILSFFFTDTLAQMIGRSPEQEESKQAERDRLNIYQKFYLTSKFHLYWLEHAQRQLDRNSNQ